MRRIGTVLAFGKENVIAHRERMSAQLAGSRRGGRIFVNADRG
jgi:hypothetical protein